MPAVDEVGRVIRRRRRCGIPRRSCSTAAGTPTAASTAAFPHGLVHGLEKDRSFDSLVDVVIPGSIGIRWGRAAPRSRRRIRGSIASWRSAAGGCSIRSRSGARAVTAFTTGAATSTGRASTRCRHRSGAARHRVRWVPRGVRVEPAGCRRRSREERGLCGATPLTGVWANYPYLHNGSVPTLYHLLGPVSERPKIFYVMAARHLDRERSGSRCIPLASTGGCRSVSCCGATEIIATGSIRAPGSSMPVTTSGGASAPTRTAGR